VTDIFREVEEDVRRERIEKLWKAYGNYVIALVVLLFVGIAGWQLWQRHQDQERVRYSDRFIAAQRITNPQAAANAFADIARSAPKGYAILAKLSQASAMFMAGQRNEAIELFKQIAMDDSGTIGSVARLRATDVSHAPGLSGTPFAGQLATAVANASCIASSARSNDPLIRMSVARMRPDSWRKTESMVD